jgi:hypothetical protein
MHHGRSGENRYELDTALLVLCSIAHDTFLSDTSWAWQYIFLAAKRSIDPRSGRERRHHLSETVLQKAVKHTIGHAGLDKHGSCSSDPIFSPDTSPCV